MNETPEGLDPTNRDDLPGELGEDALKLIDLKQEPQSNELAREAQEFQDSGLIEKKKSATEGKGRFNPLSLYHGEDWDNRKWWKKEGGKEDYESRLESIKSKDVEYGGEIQDEAEAYASAYQEYERIQHELEKATGQEQIKQPVDSFISEIDARIRPRYGDNEVVLDKTIVTPEERAELFKELARDLAMLDFLAPKLGPRSKRPYEEYAAMKLPSGATYITGKGNRMLRMGLGKDRMEALAEVDKTGASHLLELKEGISRFRGGPSTESRTKYVPLTAELHELIGKKPDLLLGEVKFYPGPIGLGDSPVYTITKSAKTLTPEQLVNQETPVSVSIDYVEYDAATNTKTPKSFKLSGSKEEIRQQVEKLVADSEWAPGNEGKLTQNFRVTAQDGETVDWETFTGRDFDFDEGVRRQRSGF